MKRKFAGMEQAIHLKAEKTQLEDVLNEVKRLLAE